MNTELADKIISNYKTILGNKPWGDAAVSTLRDVLYCIDKPAKKEAVIDNSPIDYIVLRKFIEGRNIDGIYDKLKIHLDEKNIHTNSDLVKYVDNRKDKSIYQDGVRDLFGFRATGHSGVKALYTYMSKILNYCPFENGYNPRELNTEHSNGVITFS